MKLIRNVLILSVNTDWSRELKNIMSENKKVNVEVSSARSDATKLLTDQEFDVVIIEETFKIKNMDYFLRSLMTLSHKPKIIYFTFNDFELFKTVNIPDSLKDTVVLKALSLPMTKETLRHILFEDLFPYGHEEGSEFDREFIQVLIKASNKVFLTLGITDIKSDRPQLLSKIKMEDIVIRGKIILKTDFFSGSVFFSFSEQTYKNLYEKVVMEKIEEINDANKDFAGELANMVYGQSKKELEEHGINLDMAIPVLDQSKELKSSNPIYVIPTETSIGIIYIKVAPNFF